MKKKPFENLSIRIRFILMIMLELICVSLISWIVMDVLHISDVPYIVWIILASVIAGGVLNNFLSIRYFGPVLKLEKAMQVFPMRPDGKVCMDIGASTGGFTDCMLKNGAVKVYAVDVGYGQLAWSLRTDERVVNMERTNIRNVTPDMLGDKIAFFSVDVSFISLKHIFPVADTICTPDAVGVCLVKPQFEAGREKVGKKGVVREPATHAEVLHMAQGYAMANHFTPAGLDFSPIKGPEGNIEFLMYVQHSQNPQPLPEGLIEQTVANAHAALDKAPNLH